MRLLIYTDSRGQHTPRGEPVHDVFATRLANRPDVEATVLLCPMKWTTTIDFLDTLETHDPRDFDHTILYTGIVDWSPRPLKSAINDLYNNPSPLNLDNLGLNTREYARKVVNNKKASFDRIFTASKMQDHFSHDLGVAYEGQPTTNMYSLEMAERYLLPQLKAIDNLIFINSNRFIPGWEGDYPRGRPTNISLTEQYSGLFRDKLGPDKIIDLLQWDEAAVRVLTCDNLHLSKAGSDWIYEALCDRIGGVQPRTTRTGNGGPSMKVETFSSPPRPTEPKNDSILIIGNGPSARRLAEFGFDRLPDTIDTFGMGAAYRYFEEINWWPTYYAWCDVKVVHSHREAFKALIDNPAVTTKEFFFSLPISSSRKFTEVPHGSTGDFCFRKAVELGYKNIYLIGIEGDYVEELAESRPLTDKEYYTLKFDELFPLFEHLSPDPNAAMALYRDNLRIIEQTPAHNPNYFFEGYQRTGDVYSLPRAQTHRNSWRNSVLAASRANVVNLSPDSKIDFFRKASWEAFAEFASDQMAHRDVFAPNGRAIEAPTRLSADDRARALREAGLGPNEHLATLVIGVRLPEQDDCRVTNLRVLLDWIDCYYGDLFDVLLLEQDNVSRIERIADRMRPYVRHEFVYNPDAFNRGWGYNVAVKHFTTAKVVGLLDTDVLLGANFVQEVVDCHSRYKAVSPYTSVYYTEPDEAARISLTFDLDHLRDATHITKPTTICGGIVIIRRDTFLKVAGFEQYIEFAGEDRSLDVTLLNYCAPGELRSAPYTYAHLNHPYNSEARPRAKELFAHLHGQFGCKHDPSLGVMDNIHKNCRHVAKDKTLENSDKRRAAFGDVNLYRSGRTLTINGQYADAPKTMPEPSAAPAPASAPASASASDQATIFPPAFKSLDTYAARELYEAPEPDSDKLAKLFNAYKGKRCFIIGNGPSLNKHDLSLLKNEYTFAVNSIYYKTAETGFRPTFFVVEDDAVMRENIENIRAYEAPHKFFPTNYKSLHPGGSNVFFFRMNRGFYEKSSPNYCVPRFSTDASKVLYCGQSVTYINLQLAFFMGFTEVYLIGMDFDYVIPAEHERKGDFIYSTTDDPNHFHKDYFGKGKTWKDPKLQRVGMNYRQAKVSFEAVGRSIYNATIGGKLEIFERVDYNRLLKDGVKMRPTVAPAADSSVLEMPRDAHATVIETKVVSALLQQRRGADRVMLDVGAHVGLTASYFHELGWTVHCFEPDPKNRAKLEERYRGVPNITIDTRAVSDKPAHNVAFFTSEESTGISGLHAFHNTHKQTGAVDVTTLRDVAAERNLKRIDFLKIDVEGFDFSVLKGVPWETLKPDVVECEFEDSKTLRLGHSWRDVAEFLRGKGYTVYVSEWHPIVRYGIRHDWRRLWRYPEFDMEPTAWGNFVAFREDPGYPAVRAAFTETMKLYPDKPGAKPAAKPAPLPAATQLPPPAQLQMQPPSEEFTASPLERRAFYADFGERLRARSPAVFNALRFLRRALAGLWRRRLMVIPALVVLAAVPMLALTPALAAYRDYLWGVTAFLVAMAAIGYVAMRLYVAIGHQIIELQEATRRIDELRDAAGRLDRSLAHARQRLLGQKEEDQKLRRDLDKRVGMVRAELDVIRAKMNSDFRSLRGEISSATGSLSRSEFDRAISSLWTNLAERETTLREALMSEVGARAEIRALLSEVGDQNARLRDDLVLRLAELRAEVEARQAAVDAQNGAIQSEMAKRVQALKAEARAEIADLAKHVEALKAQARTDLATVQAEVGRHVESLRTDLAKREATLQQQVKTTSDNIQKAFAVDRANVARLRERLAASERQIGAVKYTDTPATLVFFGHHKCASRFFRNEIFSMAAEVLNARVRKYEIKFPPFHYSMSDELDLVNTDLERLGENGRDVVLFSNATIRTLERIRRKAGEDWRGLRIIRDPRQVLVSGYLHHKDGHHTEWNGWVWDQLKQDKPILNELPQEEGLLYELDSISKQIIETQVLAPFDDPRVMTIKIEDFAIDSRAYLQKISEFLRMTEISGIDFSRTAANPDSRPWQQFFTSKLRQVFKERYGQALIDLGYAEDFDW